MCGINFKNFFQRIESLYQRTLIRILYEFLFIFCLKSDFTNFLKFFCRYDEFLDDEAKIVPGAGENGAAVQLEGAEAIEAERRMASEAFNIIASDKISLHRTVPDTRDPRCKAVTYDEDLPNASVIIIFTNEAWSPLIRTIWSVLETTTESMLHEIILVDDFSDKKHLRGKLTRYIQKKLPSKVKMLRLKSRQGLIRARLEGAKLATGDVLLYLGKHFLNLFIYLHYNWKIVYTLHIDR